MKYESTSDKPNSSNKKLLSWDELLEKGTLLKDTIQRLSLTPDRPYLVTKSCTDGTFQKGDLIFLEPGRDLFSILKPLIKCSLPFLKPLFKLCPLWRLYG